MSQDSLQLSDTGNKLTVTLHKNPFDAQSYIGSISRQTVTLNTLAKRIKENDAGLSEYTIFNVAGQLKKEALNAIKRGQAVNVLGLGTLYMVPDGTVSLYSPDDALSKKISLRFTPSSDATDAVSDLKINLVTVSDPAPQINSIMSLPSVDGENVFKAGKAISISGDKLKIGGEDSGIFLCKADDEGNVSSAAQVQVGERLIVRNKMRELEFFIPSDLAPGSYRIKLVTRSSGGSTMRKTALTALSDTISITA